MERAALVKAIEYNNIDSTFKLKHFIRSNNEISITGNGVSNRYTYLSRKLNQIEYKRKLLRAGAKRLTAEVVMKIKGGPLSITWLCRQFCNIIKGRHPNG